MISFFRWRIRKLLRFYVKYWMPVQPERPIKRILCLVAGGIGDRFMALPALRFLRKRYPDAYLCVIWQEGEMGIVNKEFDKTYEFERSSAWQVTKIAKQGFDLCFVNTIGVFRVACELASIVSGAPMRIGPRPANDKPGRSIYTHEYELNPHEHETVINCKSVGWSGEEIVLPYWITLSNPPAVNDQKWIIGFHVGSKKGYEFKRWPAEKYKELIERLDLIENIQFLFIGTKDEDKLMRSIASSSNRSIIHVLSNFNELLEEIFKCSVFVGNDSGPCHLAAALQIPLVVIMGPTDSKRCAPVFTKGKIFQGTCPSSPCYYEKNRNCGAASAYSSLAFGDK